MTRPRVIDTIDGWTLTRWDYDGAPLVASRPDGTSVEFSKDGALEFELEDRGYTWSPSLPASVLYALLDDARNLGLLPKPDPRPAGQSKP